MSFKLADAATRGASTVRHATPEQELLAAGDIEGLIAIKRSIFGAARMEKDDDDDGDDDADKGGDDDDDDDDDDDEKDDDKSDEAKRIEELQAENKRRRLRARKDKQTLADLQKENDELKRGKAKPKPKKDDDADDDADDDKSNAELEAERAKTAKLEERLVNQQLRSEFNDLTTGSKALAVFKNPKAAFRLLDLDDVEIDDDGTIDGLDDAIKALVKSDPYLLVDEDGDDDDDDDKGKGTQQRSRTRNRRTGQPRGTSGKKGEPSRDKLITKYRIQR